jgi:hypothetical protein
MRSSTGGGTGIKCNSPLVYGTGISSFLFKYFVLFHHTTGATDHVSENDLYEI